MIDSFAFNIMNKKKNVNLFFNHIEECEEAFRESEQGRYDIERRVIF